MKPQLPHVLRILVVCHANQVRSPLVAGLVSELAPQWQIDSAGISDACVGQPIDPRVKAELIRRGLFADHQSRILTTEDGDRHDHIWFVDRATLRHPRRPALRGAARIELLDDADLIDPGAAQGQVFTDFIARCEAVAQRIVHRRIQASG